MLPVNSATRALMRATRLSIAIKPSAMVFRHHYFLYLHAKDEQKIEENITYSPPH